MFEKRLLQWYASDAGVDLDVAEREVVLTYVLRILADAGLLQQLAFKGGTAIRKLHLGHQGRFSLDMDFTAVGALDPEEVVLELVGALQGQTAHGLTFSIPSSDYYANPDSCGAVVTYSHAWVTDGRFGVQISFRDPPLLPLSPTPLRPERYFEWLGFAPPKVPARDLHEILGEKIRAASQRSRVRDLYDLYQFASHRFDRELVRHLAVLKCWETRWKFDAAAFLAGLSEANYDWLDLRRLVRRSGAPSPDAIIQGVRHGYAFLAPLEGDEALLARDAHGRERRAYGRLVSQLPGQLNAENSPERGLTMSPGYVHRGLSTHDIPRLRKREHRSIEVFVDCYGDSEAAAAIEVYLSDALDYPFPAIWRRPDGSRERIAVVALSGNWQDDTGLIFEVESDEGDDLAPAHQVHGLRPGRIKTMLDDYRAWWPYDLLELADDLDEDE